MALDQLLCKTGTPSTDDLLLLAFELGSSWKMLGRALGLPEPVMEQTEVDSPKLFERCYGVLRRWTEVFGSAATYKSLGKALLHPIVGRGELAVKYCDVCRDVYQGKKRAFGKIPNNNWTHSWSSVAMSFAHSCFYSPPVPARILFTY